MSSVSPPGIDIAFVDAAVILPCASTVIDGIAVADP